MLQNKKGLIIGLLLPVICNAQLERFIYDVEGADGRLSPDKVVKLLPLNNDKNIFFFSEDRHDYTSLQTERNNVILELAKNHKIDLVFNEFPYVDHKLIEDNFFNRLNIDNVIKECSKKYTDYLLQDYKDVKESSYNDFLIKMQKADLLNKIFPIDIGTSSTHLGLFYYAGYTKTLNTERNMAIDRFCDSIRQQYSLEFNNLVETKTDSPEEVRLKLYRMTSFLNCLRENEKYKTASVIWSNIFSSYYQTQFNLKKNPAKSGASQLNLRFEREESSFRDSILYSNVLFNLSMLQENWSNIVMSFSTYHLLDTKKNIFNDFLDTSTNTLGRYLHSKYSDRIIHVALVCNSGIVKDHLNNNKNYKKSLEYNLSRKYNFAYVDLKGYYESGVKKEPFYLRPTFERFIKFNWETTLDGILFINNCGCNKLER